MKEQIKQLREALAKTTQGYWWWDGISYIFVEDPNKGDQMIADDQVEEVAEPVIRMRGVGAKLPIEANAEFIALTHNLMPDLLAYIEKLEREAEAGRELREAVDEMKNWEEDESPTKQHQHATFCVFRKGVGSLPECDCGLYEMYLLLEKTIGWKDKAITAYDKHLSE